MNRKRNSGRGFDRVVNNIAKSLVKEVEYFSDEKVFPCRLHTGLDHTTTAGYKCVHFKNFDELDKYLSQEDPEWRTREWAKYWLRNHWSFQTSEFEREDIHKKRGIKFKQRALGSIRYTRGLEGPKRLTHRVSSDVLAVFIQQLQSENITSVRGLAVAIKEKYNISLSYETIRRLKRKYNI